MYVYEFSIFDVLPYFYLLVFLLYFNSFCKSVKALNVMFVFLFTFSAIRYGIGYDYFNYCNAIQEGREFEPLSSLFAYFARMLGSPQFFFILNSLITIFPIYFVARKLSLHPHMSLLLYYLFPIFFLESLSIVRNASAYSLIFLSFYYLKQRRHIYYGLCVVIAGLIHSSGFIGFLLFPICYWPLDKKIATFIFMLSFFVGEFIFSSISNMQVSTDSFIIAKLHRYADHAEEQGRFIKYIIVGLNILNLLYWKKLVSVFKDNTLYLNLVNVGTCFWLLFNFDKTMSLRTASFFLLFSILLIPSYLFVFQGKKVHFVKMGILLFFILFFSSGFIVNILSYDKKGRMSYIPYQTIIFHNQYSNYK